MVTYSQRTTDQLLKSVSLLFCRQTINQLNDDDDYLSSKGLAPPGTRVYDILCESNQIAELLFEILNRIE